MKTTLLILSLLASTLTMRSAGPPEVRLFSTGAGWKASPPPLPPVPVNKELRAIARAAASPCPKCKATTQRLEEFKASHRSTDTKFSYKLKCVGCGNLWDKGEVVK